MQSSNYTEHNNKQLYYHTHTQYTTALQPNVLLAGIHHLQFTNKGQSGFFGKKKNCQGQLKTPQLLTVHHALNRLRLHRLTC